MDTDLPYDMAPDYFDSDEEKEFSRLDEHYRKTNPNKIYFYSTNLEQNEEDYDPIIHRACNPDTLWSVEELIDLQTSLRKLYHNTRERLNLYRRDFSRLPSLLYGNQDPTQKFSSSSVQNQNQESTPTGTSLNAFPFGNNNLTSAEQLRLERLESRKEMLSIENSGVLVKKDAKYLNRNTEPKPQNHQHQAELEKLREKEKENALLENHVLVRQKCSNESLIDSHGLDMSFQKLQDYQNSLVQYQQSKLTTNNNNKDEESRYLPLTSQEILNQNGGSKSQNGKMLVRKRGKPKRKLPYPYPNKVQSVGKRYQELQARTEISLLLIAAAAIDKQRFDQELDPKMSIEPEPQQPQKPTEATQEEPQQAEPQQTEPQQTEPLINQESADQQMKEKEKEVGLPNAGEKMKIDTDQNQQQDQKMSSEELPNQEPDQMMKNQAQDQNVSNQDQNVSNQDQQQQNLAVQNAESTLQIKFLSNI